MILTEGDCISLQAFLTLGGVLEAPWPFVVSVQSLQCLIDSISTIPSHPGAKSDLHDQVMVELAQLANRLEGLKQKLESPSPAAGLAADIDKAREDGLSILQSPGAQVLRRADAEIGRLIDTAIGCLYRPDFLRHALSDSRLRLTDRAAAKNLVKIAAFVDRLKADPDLARDLRGLAGLLVPPAGHAAAAGLTASDAPGCLAALLEQAPRPLAQAVLDFLYIGDHRAEVVPMALDMCRKGREVPQDEPPERTRSIAAMQEWAEQQSEALAEGREESERWVQALARSLWKAQGKSQGRLGDPGHRVNDAGRLFEGLLLAARPHSADKWLAKLEREKSLAKGMHEAVTEEALAWTAAGKGPMALEDQVLAAWQYLHGALHEMRVSRGRPLPMPRAPRGRRAFPLGDWDQADEGSLPGTDGTAFPGDALPERDFLRLLMQASINEDSREIGQWIALEDLRSALGLGVGYKLRSFYAKRHLEVIQGCQAAVARCLAAPAELEAAGLGPALKEMSEILDSAAAFFDGESWEEARGKACAPSDPWQGLATRVTQAQPPSGGPLAQLKKLLGGDEGQAVQRALTIAGECRPAGPRNDGPPLWWFLCVTRHDLDQCRHKRVGREEGAFTDSIEFHMTAVRGLTENCPMRSPATNPQAPAPCEAACRKALDLIEDDLEEIRRCHEAKSAKSRIREVKRWEDEAIEGLDDLRGLCSECRAEARQAELHAAVRCLETLEAAMRKATHNTVDLVRGFDLSGQHKGLAAILRTHRRTNDYEWIRDALELKRRT